MQPVSDITRQHSWQSSGVPALVGDYTQYMQRPGQHQQQAGSMAAPAPWQTVVYPAHPTQTASSIAAADDLAHLAPYDTAALSSQQQQQQQLDQHTVSPEVPSATNFPGPGDAAVMNPCNNSSLQISDTSGANDADTVRAESLPEGMQDGGDLSSNKPSLPVVQLKVACGDQVGTLLVHKAKIVMFEGTLNEKEVSPTEFERLGGRSATKKWKQSIRLIDDDGDQGRPVGEWYIQQGLEQPKKPRDIKDPPSTSTAPPGSTSPNNHDTRYSVSATAQATAAAVPTGPNKRPVRSTRGHVPAKHVSAAAEGSPVGGRSSRRGHGARAAAAAAGGRAYLWDDSGSGTTDSPDDPVTAAAAAAARDTPWMPDDQLQQQYMIQQMQQQIILPDQHVQQQQQQQQQQQGYGGLISPADSTAAAAAAEEATLSLDYAALGDWQLPPTAAAGPQGVLVQVPVSAHLPGDASEAVVEMSAYLEGRRRIPPWRLLPPAQRPVVGKYLVPLRLLFALVLQAGGHSVIQDDLLTWQDFAAQLGLPAWPCPDAPDPLRALQQVYRDYLLRFEGRFTLQSEVKPSADPAAAGVVQGLIQQSPSLSAATQLSPPGVVMQLPQGLAAMHGVPLSSGTTYVPVGGGMLDTTNMNNFNGTVLPVLGSSLTQQQQQQQLQPQVNNALPAALAAEIMLDDNLSGDLLDFLTDLIPDSDSTAAAAQLQQQQGGLQPPPPAAAAAPAGPVETAGGTMQGDLAAAAAPTAAVTAVMRQHPEMTHVQQRQRLQQLQQHLQYLQQQQPQQSSDSPTPAAVQPGSTATGAAIAQGGPASAAGRNKRPAPLIRCGDSDLISLMDQSEVTKLLQDYEQQQQRRQLAAVLSRQQQQQQPLLPGLAPQQQQHPSSSRLAAAVAGAVDRNMSQDLQAMMQQFWSQQQQQQQQQQVVEQQLQGEQHFDDKLHIQTADEEMSGMLESLQLAGDAAAGGQQQQGDQLLISPITSGSGWSNKLLHQMSIGARLMGDLMAATAAGSSSSSHVQTMHTSGDHTAAAGLPPIAQPTSPPGSYTMLPPARRNLPQQQQQQQGPEDPSLSRYKEVQGFGQGLLRLTTPNSAMFASVLDSPTLRTSGPSGAGWMDMSGLLSNTGNTKNMSVELPGVEGQQGGGDQGGQGDDLSAVLRMW